MAQSLSYKEAVAKGLVYPGSEAEALKLTGGGKGFASSEAFKKAFETSYQAKKSEVDALGGRISDLSKTNAEINRLYAVALADRSKHFGGTLNRYINAVKATEFYGKTPGGHIPIFRAKWARDLLTNEIDRLAKQQKGLSGAMETAMGKYQTATKEAVTAEKRETGAAAAARKRLTRGTAGLLAKAGGAGGMVGTGLPDLGTGMGGGLGIEGQLGRKVTL